MQYTLNNMVLPATMAGLSGSKRRDFSMCMLYCCIPSSLSGGKPRSASPDFGLDVTCGLTNLEEHGPARAGRTGGDDPGDCAQEHLEPAGLRYVAGAVSSN